MEITALQIARKELREASTNLSSYATEFPFSNSSLCHGYLGMVSLALWDQQYRHALCLNRAPTDIPTNYLLPLQDEYAEEELPEESRSAASARLSALRAFERAVYNAPHNLTFVRYLVQLRLACDLAESALDAVNQYCELCPDDPAGHRLYLDFSKQIDPDEEDLEDHLMVYQQLDPVSDTKLALNALLDRAIDNSKGEQSTSRVSEISLDNLQLLADRLDYGTPGVEERETWLRLIQILHTNRLADVNARTESERHIWEHRAEWWPKFHFYPVLRRKKRKRKHPSERDIQTIDEGEGEHVKELHDYKSIAALLIFPEQFCSEDVSVALGRERTVRILTPYGLWTTTTTGPLTILEPASSTAAVSVHELDLEDEEKARKRRILERKQNEREVLRNSSFRFVRMDEEDEELA